MEPHLTSAPRTLADWHAAAQAKLPPAHWAYLCGHAADGHTARANAAAWQQWQLCPRVMTDLGTGHDGIQLMGRRWPSALLVAPMAYQTLAHPDGELASALAASAQGVGYVLSAQASTPLTAVTQAIKDDPGRGPLWMQLYPTADRADVHRLAAQAVDAGYEALVCTVDAPVSGMRDAELRSGFVRPAHVRAIHLPPAATGVSDRQAWCQGRAQHGARWADLAELARHSGLPVWIKGVLHPQDACLAAEHGAAGVIVSNHGGRVLDTAVPTAYALPRVTHALAQAGHGALPVLVDGGIRRGTDVIKALALGAQAVLVGQPVLWGLAAGGAAGVAQVLRLLRDEVQMAQALCGWAHFDQPAPTGLLLHPATYNPRPHSGIANEIDSYL